MKKLLIAAALISMLGSASAQVAPGKYFVRFTDKNNSPYSINNPEEYLSPRAIERRERQNIPVDVHDLPVNPQYLAGVASAGATILNPTKWLNGVTVFTLDPSVITAIQSLPYVAGVSLSPEPSGNMNTIEKSFFSAETFTKDVPSGLRSQSGTAAFNYGMSLNQIQMLNGDVFHEMGYRGQGMVIAVLDAGFLNANTHQAFDSLWANSQILGTRDFVRGGESTFDEHPHGSMVLSTMGGNYPGQLIGTAPKASYWLLRSEDGGSEFIIEEYNWVSAAEFADSVGADVINSSLGYTEFNDPIQNHTYSDLDGDTAPATIGADFAASRGILVVNSLGNEGGSPWYYLSVPSDGDSVMGIGAVDPAGNKAGFSSFGPSYDGRVKPNVSAQGSSTYIADVYSTSGFTFGSGTSFSSPILAGMAACLWQANPTLNNMQLKNAIEQSGTQASNPDFLLGYGIPDFVMANNILTIIDAPENRNLFTRIYPNPAREWFSISLTQNQPAKGRVEVNDISGRLISSHEFAIQDGESPRFELEPGMKNGIYLVKIVADNFVNSHILIVQ